MPTKRTPPQPIISSAEAWHLARAKTLEDLTQRLDNDSPSDADQQLYNLREAVKSDLLSAWTEYFAYVGAPQSVQDNRAAISVKFDAETSVPLVSWPVVDAAARDRWEFLDVMTSSSGGFVMTAPFRPVQLSRLPEGSKTLALNDPRHSAAATMVEALECANRDVSSAFLAVNVGIAWRRLNQMVAIYRQGAKVVFKSMSPDDFHSWRQTLPARITLDHAVNLICQVGATARAHEMLAFHLTAEWMQAQADRIERASPPKERKAAFLSKMDTALARQKRVLEPMHQTALEQAGIDPATVHCQVVFNPLPSGGPVMVAIPQDAAVPVAELRQRA